MCRLEQALQEVLEEEEAKTLAAHRAEQTQRYQAELEQVERIDAAEQRRVQERERRVKQREQDIKLRSKAAELALAKSLAKEFVAAIEDNVCTHRIVFFLF